MNKDKKEKLFKITSIMLVVFMLLTTLSFNMPGIFAAEDEESEKPAAAMQADELSSGSDSDSAENAEEPKNKEEAEPSEPVKKESNNSKDSDKETKEQVQPKKGKRLNAPIKRNRSEESFTVTYHAGDGTFNDGSTENVLTYEKAEGSDAKISKTPNVGDDGVATSPYSSNCANKDIVTISGASQLQIEVWYSTEAGCDWLAIYPEDVTPSKTNYNQATISGGRLDGHGSYSSYTRPNDDDTTYHRTFTVDGDTAQFYFVSDGSVEYYGYYAIVTADASIQLTDGEMKTPSPNNPDYVFKGWHLNPDLSDPVVKKLDFTEETELYAEYGTLDFQMSMIYYDSDVDNGRTALNSDTPCVKYYERTSQLSGNLTLQVNYEADDLQKTYAPGEFTFKVYGLEKFGLKNPSIAGNLFNSTHHEGIYNPATGTIENDYWTFTNKNTIEAGESVEGMVQLVYSITKYNRTNSSTPISGSSGSAYVEYEAQTLSPIDFSFTEKKSTYSLSNSSTNDVKSISRFDNGDNYYWTRQTIGLSGINSSAPLKIFSNNTFYYEVKVPEGCELYWYQNISGSSNTIYTDSFYKLTPDHTESGMDIYKIPLAQAQNYSGSLFVGYPKSDFNVNDSVSISIDAYGRYDNVGKDYEGSSPSPYANTEAELLCHKDSNSISLKEFVPPPAGSLLSWEYDKSGSYKSLTPSVISSEDKRGIYGPYSTVSIHNEAPIDIIYGWDSTVGIETDSADYVLLEDGETYLSDVYGLYYMKRILDLNNIPLDTGTCVVELWTKELGASDYTLAVSTTNSDKDDTYNVRGKKITAYYTVIKGLPAGDWKINSQSSMQTVSIYKEAGTYKVDGNVVDAAYLMISDAEGNSLTTPTSESSYPVTLQNMGIPERDLELYGHYMNRKMITENITPDKYYGEGGMECVSTSTQTSGQTDYLIDIKGGIVKSKNGTKYIDGYDMYFTLPVIASVDINKIKETTAEYLARNPNMITGDVSDKNAWIADYLDRSTITMQDNYDGNGNKLLHIHIDYDQLDISKFNNVVWPFIIPVTVYDTDILDYGGAVNSYLYQKPVVNLSTINSTNGGTVAYNDNESIYNIYEEQFYGSTTTDRNDIDGDGDTSETFIYNKSNGNLLPAFDAQQEMSKLVKTDKAFFKTGSSAVSSGAEYTYRLRARTAATGMTNLVMYDNIETYKPAGVDSWHGTYTGIDLSRSQAQGHVPTVYYSTSATAGKLSEDTSWQLYDDSVDLSTVKSLAFDYGNQVIQPNNIASVDITMRAPSSDSDLYAYNKYNAEWRRVDPATGHIFPTLESLESSITILSLNDEVSDTVTLNMEKLWTDASGETIEPEETSLAVELHRRYISDMNGNEPVYTEEKVSDITLRASENWAKTTSIYERFHDSGAEYEYYIIEPEVPEGYEKTEDGLTITNKAVPTKNLSVSKQVTGNMGDKNKDFEFEIKFSNTEVTGTRITRVATLRMGHSSGYNNASAYIPGYSSMTMPQQRDAIKALPLKENGKQTVITTPASGGDIEVTLRETTISSTTTSGNSTITTTLYTYADDNAQVYGMCEIITTESNTLVDIDNVPEGATRTATGTYSFSLKHGEDITFESLPQRINYTVTEKEADQNGYITNATAQVGTVAADKSITGTLTDDESISYTNASEMSVPTGTRFDYWPMVTILAISAMLAWVFARKRKNKLSLKN